MRVFYFTEQAYPDAWSSPEQSLRVSLPNKNCDPVVAHALFKRYQDEFAAADELGFNIMVNEHHASATCMSASAAVTLAILARITKKARLLSLGMPVANRSDPVRVAEELAMVDVISGGRLEMGFVRGVPYEAYLAPSSPVGMSDRLWEAHDLVIKAMTEREGPFRFDGDHFQVRSVNIWPRPYQTPHPPVWITSSSAGSMRKIAEHGYIAACFLAGYKVGEYFAAYRKAYAASGRGEAGPDRLGYLGLCAIGRDDREIRERAQKMITVHRVGERVGDAYRNPAGYLTAADNARILRAGARTVERSVTTRGGKKTLISDCTMEDFIEAGMLFAGTPDQVYQQIIEFSEGVGGIGNIMLMMQGGTLSHRETIDSLELFSKEVLPRLQEYEPPTTVAPTLIKQSAAEANVLEVRR
jgi:alkanesulfonate monooxygenase SsuD/methylene tetrahydromethanopterin reductase-like flavin-dependent oxidoreductase (luciferase family)